MIKKPKKKTPKRNHHAKLEIYDLAKMDEDTVDSLVEWLDEIVKNELEFGGDRGAFGKTATFKLML